MNNVPNNKQLQEFSVVYTDRAVNHMSQEFQQAMRDLSTLFKTVYHAEEVILIPGSGTTAMEAVARQFAREKKCLCLRNGFFNFRWSQIFAQGHIPNEEFVLKAHALSREKKASFLPPSLEEVNKCILEKTPNLVFATHVETSSGIMLSDEYIAAIAEKIHSMNGYLVLDCVASGARWIDMQALGVDILITAPQKCWSAPPSCGIVLLNKTIGSQLSHTTSDSFDLDLNQWLNIMRAYEQGKFAYYATMPTNALIALRNSMLEAQKIGFSYLKDRQLELGTKVRSLFKSKGFISVAEEQVASPSIAVYYTDDPTIQNGQKWQEYGIQISSGVPLKCGEQEPFQTFRIGLLGWDKLNHIDQTVDTLKETLKEICKEKN